MSAFTTQTGGDGLLNRTRNGRLIRLEEELCFARPAKVGGERIVVPIGATSDGASIPRMAWPLLAPFGDYWLACVVHDWLYRGTLRERSDCDLILWEGMIALGVPRETARVIYNAVDQAGGSAFEADRAAQAVMPAKAG